jgi:hypothetical protein
MKSVFITGCPRSGTTMLASMLGSCHNSVATPESDFFIKFYFKYLAGNNSTIETSFFVKYLSNNYRFKQWGLNVDTFSFNTKFITASNFNIFIEEIVKLFAKSTGILELAQFNRIDHTPSNLKYFSILNNMFPESKFVFIVRDPRAVYSSVKNLDWGANSALRLSHIWTEYVANYYALSKLYPERIILVKYEDILQNPSVYLNDLCKKVDLEYDEYLLEGKGFSLPRYTVKQHGLVGKPLNSSKIDSWKTFLNKSDVLIIESICDVLMESFGYSRVNSNRLKIGTKNHIKSTIYEVFFYFLNKFKKSKREKSV